MKKTETYDLNLIEMSDTFSPAPLNENAQKLEDAVANEAAQRTAGDEALSQRVTTLEGHKIVAGTFNPTGSNAQTVQLGFDPIFVLVGSSYSFAATATPNSTYKSIKLVSGGFTVTGELTRLVELNYLAVL